MGKLAVKTGKLLKIILTNYWFRAPVYLALAFLSAIFVRVFVFEVYTIPSSSMKQTLLAGDKVVVSKLRYGPYLPSSLKDVPWLKVFHSGPGTGKHDNAKTGRRLKGYGRIRRNDVIVFDHPQNSRAYIKRCVGMAGDSLELSGETLFVNGQRLEMPSTVSHDYRIAPADNEKLISWAEEKKIRVSPTPKGRYKGSLSMQTKQRLQQKEWIDSLALLTGRQNHFSYTCKKQKSNNGHNSPASSEETNGGGNPSQWKNFNFGPLYVPKKGETIRLNEKNLNLYREVIERYEKHRIIRRKGKVYLDGSKRRFYRFTKNYYFMMGDNRCHSSDSRSWGFVPENHIIGKAEFVLFSNWQGEWRWERFFKGIQ